MKTFIYLLLALAVPQASLVAQSPVITNQPASRALWAGGNVMFAVGVSNAGAFTYQWQFNASNLPNGIITTVAGNGSRTNSGDGGSATAAGFAAYDIAVDTVGNLFIADEENNRIRRVDTNGIIMTVAGNGVADFTGDGGPATNASLYAPGGVAVDVAGNLFIADGGNMRVREVSTNGIITTIAGNGIDAFGGDGVPATNTSLGGPLHLTVDMAGNVFVSINDYSDKRVRKVDTNGIITTAAGNGQTAFSGDNGPATNASMYLPCGLTVDGWGNLFITDEISHRIRRVDTNGIITTVAGSGEAGGSPIQPFGGDGGQATNANFCYPTDVAVDAVGDLFIADPNNNRIREVNTNGIIATVVGNGTTNYPGDGMTATNVGLYGPEFVAVDPFRNLFITDSGHFRIRKVTNVQGPVLAMNAVMPANSGSYQLVVSGAGGSVTSSVVNLIVATTPLIYQTIRNSDGSIMLNLVSQPGSTNQLLCATNLLFPISWQSISTNLAGPDGNWQFTDTNANSYGTRFYRLLEQ